MNWLDQLGKLNDRQLKELLLQTGIVQHFDAGAELLHTGQYIKYVPIVLQGSLKVTREDESGREIFLYFIHPGESCIMTLFAVQKNTPSMVRAMVEDNAEVLLLPVEFVHRDVAGHRDWRDFTYDLFRQRYEELLHTINEIAFSRVDDRLVEMMRAKSRLTNNRTLYTTHQQLADDLGTAREVVSRLLKRLEMEGKISTARGTIKILGDL